MYVCTILYCICTWATKSFVNEIMKYDEIINVWRTERSYLLSFIFCFLLMKLWMRTRICATLLLRRTGFECAVSSSSPVAALLCFRCSENTLLNSESSSSDQRLFVPRRLLARITGNKELIQFIFKNRVQTSENESIRELCNEECWVSQRQKERRIKYSSTFTSMWLHQPHLLDRNLIYQTPYNFIYICRQFGIDRYNFL